MTPEDLLNKALQTKEAQDKWILDGWGEPEANTESGLIPDTWVDEKGIRHIRWTDLDEEPLNYIINGVWVTRSPF